ncbi:hypothetical protein E2C01_003015 [Portunus trituberculatus]|uniref:Uncharacterized protein n=1 Tax=Portunus trituberculatus TaxID=210409 RepID=A0A5B7CNM2_PORTR|nr:hypothetical protein [Portunus trituberculatus]
MKNGKVAQNMGVGMGHGNVISVLSVLERCYILTSSLAQHTATTTPYTHPHVCMSVCQHPIPPLLTYNYKLLLLINLPYLLHLSTSADKRATETPLHTPSFPPHPTPRLHTTPLPPPPSLLLLPSTRSFLTPHSTPQTHYTKHV